MRRYFILFVIAIFILTIIFALYYPTALWSLTVLGPLLLLGLYDYIQRQHAVLRNFPLIGHFRYLFEAIRPEISQYFIESDTSGRPFNRVERSLIYQRAKKVRDTMPFGTQLDVYEVGYEWINHSIRPVHIADQDLRVTVGGPDCQQPYSTSRLNISAMSFGSLSKNAVLALSQGARMGNFIHNTGEGGLSPYHLQGGGDLTWQIGTGYFGCRTRDGAFSPEAFAKNATHPNVKMIELKLSQGAKPGHGGILPAAKLTREIADIRLVEMGKDVLSPPGHSAFSTPIEMMQFIAKLRALSGGKPVGFKLCIGKRWEFIAICKAMLQTGITPDFITVDGGEGGTGAAPVEFSDHVGGPLQEGLIFVHNALTGFNLREQIRVFASGKVTDGFGMIKRLALGADACNSARGMMLALGCIQALRCNSNRCPVGVTTQNPQLVAGLVPADKNRRVAHFHREMMESFCELLGAMGISDPAQLRPRHILRRTGPNEIRHYGEIYEFIAPGSLLQEDVPVSFQKAFRAASAERFASDWKTN